ncbi:hypothetical protein N2601_08710 [Rhizobium sp. CB3060]|uniref:hypothetical protein n=1 Tax=Rhizobium sp. CB3060 TaxID=3138255 RepID=UPI0021A8637C|nr:hypothetical protein [Rhizobium tropici]UWU23010.1 hypothetical protein N2601_08710 [Rhizobium tropici]
MQKFPPRLLTKRIKNEILAHAAKLSDQTLPDTLPPEEALRPLPRGRMLALRFAPQIKGQDRMRVAFEDRSEPLADSTFRIGYDAASCMLPVTPLVLAYSISPRISPQFGAMVKSGLRQKEMELWCLQVAKLADYCQTSGLRFLTLVQNENSAEALFAEFARFTMH